jgi:hypothetical protein
MQPVLTQQELYNIGQNYFKAGKLVVGNVDYANYRTDGTNDEVQLQQAINDANSGSIKTIEIVTNLTVAVNPAFNETFADSSQRKLAVQAKDGVTIIIRAGCTIFYTSNNGTSVFGNFGNLSNFQVICEGANAFDGGANSGGSSTTWQSAVWLDARSNSCNTLNNCNFVLSGTRNAGHFVRTYNSNSSNVSISEDLNFKITNATNVYTVCFHERNGKGINTEVIDASNTYLDGVVYKDGIEQSKVDVTRIANTTRYGMRLYINPAKSGSDQFKFNRLTVNIGTIANSGDHGIHLQGFEGTINGGLVTASQKSGVFFERVQNSGTDYYPTRISITNLQSLNNNQIGSTWSGFSGIIRNLELINFEASDTQTSPTQYRGVDFSSNINDSISLISGKAERNTNSQIVVKGVNSVINEESVNGFINLVTVTSGISPYRIDGPETNYLLENGTTLTFPKFSRYSTLYFPEYGVGAKPGVTAQITAEIEDDTTYKAISTQPAGSPYPMLENQAFIFKRFPDQWRLINNSDQVASILVSKTLSSGTKLDSLASENMSLYGLGRQALSNSNFVYGASSVSNPANGSSVLSHWEVEFSNTGTLPTTITHSKQAVTAGSNDKVSYAYRVTTNGAGTGFGANDFYAVTQRVNNGVRSLCGLGRKIAVKIKGNSNLVNKKIGLYLEINYGSGGSSAEYINGNNFTLNSVDEELTFIFNSPDITSKSINSTDNFVKLWVVYMWGTGTTATRVNSVGVGQTFIGAGNTDISSTVMNVGDAVLPFQAEFVNRWIAPTLLNSWANIPGGQPTQYSIDDKGWVEIRGLVSSGTVNQPIFNLPNGYRPEFQVYHSPVDLNGSAVPQDPVLVVRTDGNVVLEQGTNNLLSLHGLRFQVKMN